MTATAALDVGKTNLKLIVFDRSGARLAERSAENRPRPGPPYLSVDVETIWAFLLAALADVARQVPISEIVVTTHGGAAGLVDETGLVLPVMDYEETGIDAVADAYRAVRPPFAETLSPCPAGALNVGKQLFFFERSFPEAFARARSLLMLPQYFAWRLSGVAASELTALANHADLWRPTENRPSSLVAARGWDHLLPPVRRPYDRLGPIRPEVAAATGLAPDTEVLTGIHDSNAALVPHLISRRPPFTVVSTGTWVVLMAVGGATAGLDGDRDMFGNIDALGRPMPAAKFMGGREFASILAGAAPTADADDLAAVIASGALPLPSFAPQGGPFEGRAGRIDGAPPDRPGARAAVASLYAALVTDHYLGALGAKGAVVIEGSFAANALYGRILASLRPDQVIEIASGTSGAAYGAALLAGPAFASASAAPTAPPPPSSIAAPFAEPLAAALVAARRRWRDILGEA